MPHIAIVGGGIGGLCTAIALRQRDIDVHVYEAAPALEPVGAGIWVPSNAMQVLDRLALSEPVARAGMALERIELCDADGLTLQQVDLNDVQRTFGHTTISIHRSALQQALVDHLAPEVLHLGKTCTAVEERKRTVRMHFDDGTHVETPVLIGADGLRSTVRDFVVPGARLRYTGQTCYRGIADLQLSLSSRRAAREIWGPGHRFGFSAIGEGAVYWFAPLDAPAGRKRPPTTVKRDLFRRYASFPEPVPAILDHTPVDTILRTDLYDVPPLDRWWHGRVVLIGDAAHAATPNLGQGAAQAMEDAYVLAAALARYDDPREAFAEYEATRMQKAKRVVHQSWRLGTIAHLKNPMARRLRNLVMRHTPALMQRRAVERLYTIDY